MQVIGAIAARPNEATPSRCTIEIVPPGARIHWMFPR